MTQAQTSEPTASQRTVSDRHGAASPNLTGTKILAAWLMSLAVHVLLLFVMLALVFPFAGDEKETVPPTTHVELVGSVDGVSFVNTPMPGLSTAAVVPKEKEKEIRFKPKHFVPLAELGVTKKPELSIIGIGAGGGDFDDYGLSVGGIGTPEFFGLGGSIRGARKIVYVVDRSGSMLETFVYVQQELKRSIAALRRSQKFHVIFFNDGAPLQNPPRKLVSAIAAQKQEFFDFLDRVVPNGGTKPERAMHQALRMEPDLIYLLSDGQNFPPDLFRKLDAWNANRTVRICTIAYVDPAGSELLERMAREHNGEFRFVSEDDLP